MPTAIITEGTGHAGTVYAGVTDAHIRQANPTNNYSTVQDISNTSWDVGDDTRGIIKFIGLSNITGPVVVSSASIFLFALASQASHVHALHRIKLAVNPAQVAWNDRLTGTAWAVPGAFDSASIDTTPVASVTGITNSLWAEFTGAGVAALVEGWINGTTQNEGVLLKRNPESHDFVGSAFASSEYPTFTEIRPYLVVTYTAGVVTPVNWTVSNPTVNSDAGTATVVLTLDAPAGAGGVNGFFSTFDITAVAPADYTARTAVPISIAEGQTTANLTVTITP